MKVVFIRPTSLGPLGSFAPGDVTDLPDASAFELLSVGKVRRFVEVPQPEPSPLLADEVATVQPVIETAALTTTAKRRASRK